MFETTLERQQEDMALGVAEAGKRGLPVTYNRFNQPLIDGLRADFWWRLKDVPDPTICIPEKRRGGTRVYPT
jgi:hypothetical protein